MPSRQTREIDIGAIVKTLRTSLLVFLGVVIAIGIVFRFSYLDRKYFYGDEVISSLRESGHTEAEFARAFDGRIRTASDISRYLSDRSTSPRDTIRSLAAEDPQHPPLYYLATRYWTQALGDTTATRRSLAALFGVLGIFAVFWLAYELFGSILIAAIAGAIVAVSPFHVIYAQQNREYSAWLFFLALEAAILFRALRAPNRAWWLAYAFTLAAALYTDALFLYDVVSFTVFIVVRERRWTPVLAMYSLATAAAFLAYVPWLVVMYRGAATITGWMGPLRVAVSPQIYLLKWFFNTASVFFDSEYQYSHLLPIAVVILFMVAAAFVASILRLGQHARAFVLSLTFVPAVAFVVSDVVAHTSRATAPRYLVPVWLGCELAVAFAIGSLVLSASTVRLRFGAVVALVFVIACGLGSNAIDLPARQTSATAEMARLGPESHAINSAADPLVVFVHDSEHWDIAIAMLSTVLRPHVRIQLFRSVDDVRIAHPASGFFLYEATSGTKSDLQNLARGDWRSVSGGVFGSQLVDGLRRKATRDRGYALSDGAEDVELWHRLPGAVESHARGV